MLIIVDKPKGISSFDVIRVLRRVLNERKIGHSGTLDLMATGLLIVGTGSDTKKLFELQQLHKNYTTTIDFSKSTDTWDMDFWDKIENYELIKNDNKNIGIIKNGVEKLAPDLAEIQKTLEKLIPVYKLPLTPFSAKKKDGKKLYELARKGELFYEYRDMKIYSFEILKYDFPELELKLKVGSGTYIRSIGYWLGQCFQLGGVLKSLRRTEIGNYNINSINLTEKAIGYFNDKEYDIYYKIVSG